MASWSSWASSTFATISDGIREFSEQLGDDTDDVRNEVRSNLASANAKISDTASALADADVIGTLASGTTRLGGKIEDAIADPDRVMRNLEGALTHVEGTATALLSRGVDAVRSTVIPGDEVNRGTSATLPKPAAMASANARRFEERVRAMETSADNFTAPPADMAAFEQWRLTFQLLEHTEEIDALLKAKVQLRTLHVSLVPSKIPYRDFWTRYFFNLHTLAEREQRLEALRRGDSTPKRVEKLSSWDFDDEAFGDAEPAPKVKPRLPVPLRLPTKPDAAEGSSSSSSARTTGPVPATEPATAPAAASPASQEAVGHAMGGEACGKAAAASGAALTNRTRAAQRPRPVPRAVGRSATVTASAGSESSSAVSSAAPTSERITMCAAGGGGSGEAVLPAASAPAAAIPLAAASVPAGLAMTPRGAAFSEMVCVDKEEEAASSTPSVASDAATVRTAAPGPETCELNPDQVTAETVAASDAMGAPEVAGEAACLLGRAEASPDSEEPNIAPDAEIATEQCSTVDEASTLPSYDATDSSVAGGAETGGGHGPAELEQSAEDSQASAPAPEPLSSKVPSRANPVGQSSSAQSTSTPLRRAAIPFQQPPGSSASSAAASEDFSVIGSDALDEEGVLALSEPSTSAPTPTPTLLAPPPMVEDDDDWGDWE